MTWTAGLGAWYAAHGRHELPWRQTRDPWAVLVSEVMLQQTQVARVVPYWRLFLERWPDPARFAAAPLSEILRAWQGLGYPRRAVALHEAAAVVSATGWPRDERSLRRLPGVGVYTARALLTLALGEPSRPPLDVNIARVAARAAAGCEPGQVSAGRLADLIAGARPRALDPREYVFALFDAGALHCRAQPRCAACPLARRCSSRQRLENAPRRAAGRRARAAPYASSMRRLRGVILAASLSHDGMLTLADAHEAARRVPLGREPGAVEDALASLRADRLIDAPPTLPPDGTA